MTGGIGSGKSVVCRILEVLGCHVYDCDSRAKVMMDADDAIKDAIGREISALAITHDRCIDRRCLASVVFNDAEKLTRLNAIVHDAVRRDIERWSVTHPDGFVETAILYESGLDLMVRDEWVVTAPEDVRIERVMSRSGLSEDEVRRRIMSQADELPAPTCGRRELIVNDGVRPVLPQILSLLKQNNTAFYQ